MGENLKKLFENKVIRTLCLASVIVVGTIVVDSAKNAMGDAVHVSIELKK